MVWSGCSTWGMKAKESAGTQWRPAGWPCILFRKLERGCLRFMYYNLLEGRSWRWKLRDREFSGEVTESRIEMWGQCIWGQKQECRGSNFMTRWALGWKREGTAPGLLVWLAGPKSACTICLVRASVWREGFSVQRGLRLCQLMELISEKLFTCVPFKVEENDFSWTLFSTFETFILFNVLYILWPQPLLWLKTVCLSDPCFCLQAVWGSPGLCGSAGQDSPVLPPEHPADPQLLCAGQPVHALCQSGQTGGCAAAPGTSGSVPSVMGQW